MAAMERTAKYKYEVTGISREELESALGELASTHNIEIHTIPVEQPFLGYLTEEDLEELSPLNSHLDTRLLNRVKDIAENHPLGRRLGLMEDGVINVDSLELLMDILKGWPHTGEGIVGFAQKIIDARRIEATQKENQSLAAQSGDRVFAGSLEGRRDTEDDAGAD